MIGVVVAVGCVAALSVGVVAGVRDRESTVPGRECRIAGWGRVGDHESGFAVTCDGVPGLTEIRIMDDVLVTLIYELEPASLAYDGSGIPDWMEDKP